jgi:hypothetical protein
MKHMKIIIGALVVTALIIPAAASAASWHYRKMNRGAQVGFMHDMARPNHVISATARVCPKDRGVVAVKGKLQYGLYFTDCPLGYIHGKPEYQGANILARKMRPGAWKPIAAGTSWLYPGLYSRVPKGVVTQLTHMLGHDFV